ncbi:QWRF motif-containing protein 2-like [Hibiscus syriacus]|uniref:QWRF motif-containing protein 2-like n=1 Tax=Hibiscus syriacus TaxID=106335 RepID=UPI001924EA43|nr:QWRF motif-containing protein 2-like [Hibiscus syriacus]
MVAAAVSAAVKPKQLGGGLPLNQNAPRPPLLTSDPDNAITPCRKKSGKFTSRYMSTSSSNSSSPPTKICPLTLFSTRTSHSKAMTTTKRTTPLASKRSQAVERRHAVTPLPSNSLDLKTSNGDNSNKCDLSVSSHGEPFSYKCRKAKPAPSPSAATKGTPERWKTTVATTPRKGTEQAERWPAKLRLSNSVTSGSVDCTDERKSFNRSVNGNVVRALQLSMTDNREITAVTPVKSKPQYDLAASDTGSVSSGSTPGAPESSSVDGDVKRGPRGIMVSARSWQDTANRLCRSDPGYPVPKKNTARSKQIVRDKYGTDSPLSSPKGVSNSRGQLWSIHWPVRPASPSKLGLGDNLVNRPSILSLVGDAIKIGENKVSDAHLLRLLHNHLLQWRFVNARADATLSSKRSNTEKSLHNAWTTTSKLLESVRAKRNELQLLRQNLKLISILKGQMIFLDEWAVLDHDYCSYLSGAIEALTASTLRLPVVCGARADIPKLKEAIFSAVNVMQAIASSIWSLLSKVAEVNTMVSEVRNLSTNELALLYRCKQVLPTIAAMRVKECSLRTLILQLNQLSPTFDNKIV